MKDEIKEQVQNFSLELLNKSERELQILSLGERSIIEFLRDNEINQYPILFFVTNQNNCHSMSCYPKLYYWSRLFPWIL